jgi:hypothetical protein
MMEYLQKYKTFRVQPINQVGSFGHVVTHSDQLRDLCKEDAWRPVHIHIGPVDRMIERVRPIWFISCTMRYDEDGKSLDQGGDAVVSRTSRRPSGSTQS